LKNTAHLFFNKMEIENDSVGELHVSAGASSLRKLCS